MRSEMHVEVSSVEPTSRDRISGPGWNLLDEYPALDSSELRADVEEASFAMDQIERHAMVLTPALQRASVMTAEEARALGVLDALADVFSLFWRSRTLLRNVAVYANCLSSVDGTNSEARKLVAKMSELGSRHERVGQPATIFLRQCSEEVLEAYLGLSEDIAQSAFILEHSRKMRDHSLTLPEENLLSSLSVPGIFAWGSLYTDLSGVLKVEMAQQDGTKSEIGLAAAAGFLTDSSEDIRRSAWKGTAEAWRAHSETCAAILNAITAWRLETFQRRGMNQYLASPLHLNRMTSETLTALIGAVDGAVQVGRKALRIQAAALKKDVLDPWDLYAPAPIEGTQKDHYSFDEGIEVIANAVGAIDPEAGDFVRLMRDRQWIEATRGNTKRPGAYCTGFAKSRHPRVYLSEYNGGSGLLLTLAHELGHAYHSWVMRDLPQPQLSYPMNLAETASIFFETVVTNDLLKRASSTEEKFAIAWNLAESAGTFLLNIPARFRFECKLNERRPQGKLSAEEIDQIMVDAWRDYYGDALGHLDEVGIFSCTKLHFYIAELSFYNFPYTFGWLFSLGVLAGKDSDDGSSSSSFSARYRALLRDTGRMTAEDVVLRHLNGSDIQDKAFWDNAIRIVHQQVDHFESLARDLGHLP
eukprot:CAMPEP_0184686594 /NCGR_PEP_ID=MMETSP0312-20130426/23119_1 /TAXON_ID=31354 /ORGANISM="Compsopogon coeruleus, Strain SAG 36.94" /LENGTH=642 /DNA_ID=CAMNT_0027141837 /DNA_START=480 /DNA_END=2408 /DNA_ORIENTATION=-